MLWDDASRSAPPAYQAGGFTVMFAVCAGGALLGRLCFLALQRCTRERAPAASLFPDGAS
jgi:hypothetical protein